MNPLKITVTPTATHLDVQVEINDTGLYGKFLADYESFINGAVGKGISVADVINAYLIEFEKNPKKENDAREIYETKLNPVIFDPRNDSANPDHNFDILTPELQLQWQALTAAAPAIQKVLSAPQTDYDTNRKDLYYEVEFNLGGQVLPVVIDREIINKYPTEKNRIYESNRGKSDICIPIENPQSLPYTYKLKISLTDEKAFTYPQYENIEYKYLEGIYTDITFIKNCASIEVGYYGPVSADESIHDSPVTTKTRRTKRSLVINRNENGINGQKIDLLWDGSDFTATIKNEGKNRNVQMPGGSEEPVRGQWSTDVIIKGSVDFVAETVSFEAKYDYLDNWEGETPTVKKDQYVFSACSIPVIDFDCGKWLRFGVNTRKALQDSVAKFNSEEISSGYYQNDYMYIKEEMLFGDDARYDDCCFYIEFSK